MIKLDVKECNFKWHWSSTEDSDIFASRQTFSSGIRVSNHKWNTFWVRAIRKVKK